MGLSLVFILFCWLGWLYDAFESYDRSWILSGWFDYRSQWCDAVLYTISTKTARTKTKHYDRTTPIARTATRTNLSNSSSATVCFLRQIELFIAILFIGYVIRVICFCLTKQMWNEMRAYQNNCSSSSSRIK